MRIACAKCNKLINRAKTVRREDQSLTELLVYCHGEIDSMNFEDEWVVKNPDFMFLITNNLTTGIAFNDPDKEYPRE